MRNPHNCLVFVLDQFWQYRGCIVARRSDSGWFPHFLYSRNLDDWWEYTPQAPHVKLFIPPPFYSGCVRHSTGERLKRRSDPAGQSGYLVMGWFQGMWLPRFRYCHELRDVRTAFGLLLQSS